MRRPGFQLALLLLLLAGCLDRSRFNASCEWSEPDAVGLDPTTPDARRHLRHDGLLAEELGIRLSDALHPHVFSIGANQVRMACTDSIFGEIARAHDVRVEDLRAARLERDIYLDILLVLVPIAVLYLLGAGYAADYVRRTYREYGLLVTVVLTVAASLVCAVLAMMVGTQWAWLVEMARLGNTHISYRAGRLPWIPYRLELFALAVIAFWLVAGRRWRRELLAQSRPH